MRRSGQRQINPLIVHGQKIGAVANATAAALVAFGVEPTELPLSPARLWQLIDARRAAARVP